MNIGELRELLEELEDLDDDTPVFVAHQPSWPLCLNLAGVIHWSQRERECPDHEGYLVDHNEECALEYPERLDELDPSADERAVWLVGGDHPHDRSPYAPRWLWEEGGWR